MSPNTQIIHTQEQADRKFTSLGVDYSCLLCGWSLGGNQDSDEYRMVPPFLFICMKRYLTLLLVIVLTLTASAKDVKVSVTPSTAKIYIDGNYVGDGVVSVPVKKSEGFIVVKMEEQGYVTLETKIYAKDKRKAVSYILRKDALYDLTVENGNANKYFTVNVSKDLYTIDSDGKKNTEKAWKLIHQILLNYFDEIQTTDINSGFIQTPWQYKRLAEIDKVVRTRVSIREISAGDNLTFQIKVSSEIAPLLGSNYEESYQETIRVIKEYEPIISEFQSRLGKL